MSQLTNNTTNLQAILDAVNALPEATEPKLQAKTATPATSAQTVKPDSGYDGLSQVTVNAMPTATQATPSISVDSAGKITASATQTAGYVAAGTKSATKQLTTQAAKTVTSSTSSQTAVASGVYTTGAVTVAAIPSSYVKPSATKTATTYTPTTSNQTIAAGTYCSGAQTIKGDSNLVAGNIKSGVSIFGVAGSYEGSGGSSGGGGVETCSVEVTKFDSAGSKIYYSKLGSDGKVEPAVATMTQVDDFMVAANLTDVVCGSVVTFGFYYLPTWVDGTAEQYASIGNYTLMKAPTVAGEHCFMTE